MTSFLDLARYRRIAALFLILSASSLVLWGAGCGGDDEDDSGFTEEDAGATGATGSEGETDEPEPVGPSDEAAARAAIEDYFAALEDQDYDAACDFFSSDALDELEQATGGTSSCPDALSQALGGQDFGTFDVVDVEVTGDQATATIDSSIAGEITNELVLEDGEWKLESP